MSKLPRIAPRIVCATDFSPLSERAFYNGLAIAQAEQAHLTLLHIGTESRENVPWERYPGVRQTLTRWGVVPADTQRDAVESLTGITVRKMAMRDEDPFHGIADYLRERTTDLLVMATATQQGPSGLAHLSLAEKVVLRTRSRSLLLPEAAPDLVDPATGRRLVKRVLFVFDHEPDPRDELPWLNEVLPLFGEQLIEVQMLYVGLEKYAPDVTLPDHPRLRWSVVCRDGKPLKTILTYADEYRPELLVMMNERPRGLFRRLRSSLSAQVLHSARRPMLLLPSEYSSSEQRRTRSH